MTIPAVIAAAEDGARRIGRLYLDSADLSVVERAARSGVVSGVTTNPSILAREPGEFPARLRAVLDTFVAGPVFYQLTADDDRGAVAELAAIDAAAGADVDRVVLKLPAQPWLFSLGARLAAEGREVAFTAIYDPGQVVCAVDAGARWLIPYVDRAARLDAEPTPLVSRLVPFVPAGVTLLAASIKSPRQALQSLRDGAAAVTATWDVIEGLMSHHLTDSAVAGFRESIRPSHLPRPGNR